MDQFIVHSIPGSPYGRAVLATLIEKGADFGFIPVAPGQTKVAPHISRHPFGRVPSIVHDGFPLYETQAIMRYIDRVLPEPFLTPTDARAAARMDQVLNIADWYLFQGVTNVIAFQRIVGPQLLGIETDLAAIEGAMPQGIKVFAELSRLLGDQPYLVGDALTLADLAVAAHADFLSATPEWTRLSEGRANIVAWLDRMRARPSMEGTTWPRVTEMAAMAAA
jgi:glutathione S-transferase